MGNWLGIWVKKRQGTPSGVMDPMDRTDSLPLLLNRVVDVLREVLENSDAQVGWGWKYNRSAVRTPSFLLCTHHYIFWPNPILAGLSVRNVNIMVDILYLGMWTLIRMEAPFSHTMFQGVWCLASIQSRAKAI